MNRALREYIEKHVLPLYDAGDKGHGPEHASYVTRRSLRFAAELPEADPDIAYAVAAYHDAGHPVDPEHHEMESARIVRADAGLRAFFPEDVIETIAQAVEDHRASLEGEPRSVYGRIVATADRDADIGLALVRTYRYRLKHCPEMSLDEMIEDSRPVIRERYGEGGTSRKASYLPDPEFAAMCGTAERITADPEAYRAAYMHALEAYGELEDALARDSALRSVRGEAVVLEAVPPDRMARGSAGRILVSVVDPESAAMPGKKHGYGTFPVEPGNIRDRADGRGKDVMAGYGHLAVPGYAVRDRSGSAVGAFRTAGDVLELYRSDPGLVRAAKRPAPDAPDAGKDGPGDEDGLER